MTSRFHRTDGAPPGNSTGARRRAHPDLTRQLSHVSMNPTVPTAFELYFGGALQPPTCPACSKRVRTFSFIPSSCATAPARRPRHRRLDDLNELVLKLLPQHRPLEIMDVAVSSGVSTAEWLIDLERAGIECHMLAGDAVVDAFLISVGPRLRALVDRTGHLMQLDIGRKSGADAAAAPARPHPIFTVHRLDEGLLRCLLSLRGAEAGSNTRPHERADLRSRPESGPAQPARCAAAQRSYNNTGSASPVARSH